MKGLRARILLVGLVSAFAALLLSRLVVRTAAEGLTTRLAAGAVAVIMAHGEAARCEADPRSWSFVIPGVSETYAYDPDTLAPLNPAAPELDLEVLGRLQGQAPVDVGVRFGSPLQRGVIVCRLAGVSSCRLVETTWRPVGQGRDALWIYLVLPVFVGAVSALFSFVLAIRPVVRRVADLRSAAALVGSERGYEVASGPTEDDLGQLARELDRAHVRIRADAEELEKDHAALERHLADVAHDLRTPIASLQLALEHATALNHDPALEDCLRRAVGDTVYAAALTENLRLASKLDGAWDPAELTSKDLRDLVERVVLRMRFFAEQQGIALEIALPDAPVVVRCQAVAVEQAVANLVENGVTLGERGGHVAVVLESKPDGTFLLTVVDDGPGVRGSQLPRLGERTFRSDEARQRAPRGSGLGLAITAAVCERTGWTLAFAPEEPRGLRVTIAGRVA